MYYIECSGSWQHKQELTENIATTLNTKQELGAAILHNADHIIIIIKKIMQCKAQRKWCTHYQFEDPSPTIPTFRQKEEEGKKSRRQ